ncbi:tRNA (N6-threonylcarbamoyladenosine(37)-N6)-methyltransferase TrmO [Acidianus infernus]|uniref:tRNA (N6-threonylcarbamoyladenosine(37)-N6)-methyltransferase TrmO n=1 Tax=Acidianus infernus TaxID=12915 RepID=A0A6A9QGU8_ACIIN|nr:TrmO family methyltransferase [Acidianus infernus]MUM65033.1 tRNA (N6-threonylcarbamoyladenosine(37)-N6)-methyltransferase TrmO [Acidianus infernus]
MSTIELKPIGYIEHNIPDELIAKTFKKFMAKVVVYTEYKDGLKGLDEFSHIVLISYLPRAKRESLQIKPLEPKIKANNLKIETNILTVGIFSTCAQYRPNPIGLSVVKLLKIQDNTIIINGCDLYNKTLILDIKPYIYTVSEEVRIAEWRKRMLEYIRTLNLE